MEWQMENSYMSVGLEISLGMFDWALAVCTMDDNAQLCVDVIALLCQAYTSHFMNDLEIVGITIA